MRKTVPSLLVPFLFLVLVIGIMLRQSPEPVPDAVGETTVIQGTKRGRVATLESVQSKALRISPHGWAPPAVFSQTGKPAPRNAYPRGKNAERRYSTPEPREVDPNLRAHASGVLAMTPADGRLHLLPEEIDLHTRLARRMVFNPTTLDKIIAGNASRLLAPTPNSEVLTLEIDSVKSRSVHSHTLRGHVLGEESTSDVQIVYHDGVIQGNIALYASGREIEYRILADGHMMVREIDSSTMTAECGKPPETVADAVIDDLSEQGLQVVPEEDGEITGDTVGWRAIDIVVGYDAGARVAQGGYSQIEALIIASVDRMTTAFSNSLIANTELILLGTIEDPDYVYPGSSSGMSEELVNLNNFSNGTLDAVSSYATRLGADLVSFVLKDADGSAGIAYRPGRTSITARTYMTSTRITFGHELGHNLGCNHSWGDSSQTYESHYGWRLDPDGLLNPDGSPATRGDLVRTIMAYDWGWGIRIPHFSNPNVNFNGAPTGAPNGHDVRTDPRADQRYYQNGYNYTNGVYGFDGTKANLGANNANTINTGGGGPSSYGATYASNRATRTAFQVISPGAGVQWARGSTQVVSFNGGDMDDTATVKLYKGGLLNSTLASGLDPATDRDYSWTLPLGLASGSDYMIRVELGRNGSMLTADSGTFSIVSFPPRVVAQSPAVSPPVNGVVSQLVLTFNNAMNPATFSVADDVVSFTGPGAANLKPAIGGAVWSSGNTVLALDFTTQSAEGSYALVLGSQIQDSDNEFLNQDMDGVTGEPVEDRYTAEFSIMTFGGALDTTSLAWVTTGNVGWFPQSAITHDGVDAVQSGDIGNSQNSSLETILTGPGSLTFWWKVSSESNFDYLRFYLDGVEQAGAVKISGTVDWVQKTVSIPTGSQTIKWTYSKDGSVDGGTDTAWVDQVVFTPASAVDNFVIGGVPSRTVVGTQLTGITITAKDAASQTATSFTGSVSFGGTAGITGTSANFVSGLLSGVSITPLTPGGSLTFTVDDGSGHTGSAILTVQSLFENWTGGTFANTFTDILPTSNPDGDSLINLQEFAFGMDPTTPVTGSLVYVAGGDVVEAGLPIPQNFAAAGQPPDFHAVFGRRKDYQLAGLAYTVQFCADLGFWTASTTTPTVLTNSGSSGDMEAVSVPFPATVPLQAGGSAAPKFFRLAVAGD